MSIDEMTCRLLGEERRPERATEAALRIKAAIRERAGEYLTCSIGIAPNTLLAKVAADMKKPDGLTVIDQSDLPRALHGLKLQDFPGIGPRMARRLNLFGILAVGQFCALSERGMAEAWGSKVHGSRWYRLLRGEDVVEPRSRRQTVSHSHILPPDLRTDTGLVWGARETDPQGRGPSAEDRFLGRGGVGQCGISRRGANRAVGMEPLGVERLAPRPALSGYAEHPAGRRTAVARAARGRAIPGRNGPLGPGPGESATPSLFEDDRKAAELSHAMDEVNREFGASVVHFGAMHGLEDAAPNRIAFTQIPDFDRRVS